MSVINPKTGRKIKIGGKTYRSCCMEQTGGRLLPIEVLTLAGQAQKFEVEDHMLIKDLIDLILSHHRDLTSLDLTKIKKVDLIYRGKLLSYENTIGDYLGNVVDDEPPYELYIFPREKVIHKRPNSVDPPHSEEKKVCLTYTPEYGKMKEPDLSFLKKSVGCAIGGADIFPKFFSFILQQFRKQLARTDEYVIGMCVTIYVEPPQMGQSSQYRHVIEIVTIYGTRLQWSYAISTMDLNAFFEGYMQNIIKYPENFAAHIEHGKYRLPNEYIDILASLCKYDVNGFPDNVLHMSHEYQQDVFFPTTLCRLTNVIVSLYETQISSTSMTENKKSSVISSMEHRIMNQKNHQQLHQK